MSRGNLVCRRIFREPGESQHHEWEVKWRTKNLYKLCVGRIGQSIVSPVFKLKKNEALIYIFPQSLKANCNSNKRKISFSIYLHIIKKSLYPLRGSVTFDLVKPSLPLGEVDVHEDSFIPNYGWGLQKSIYRKRFTLMSGWPSSTISCKISLEKKNFVKQPRLFVEPTDSPKLAADLGSLLETGRLHDVTFKIGDQELKAHKSILSARSPVFAAMFDTNMLESSSNEINIVNMEYEVMKLLLEFIYTGKLDNTDHLMWLDNLLVAADMYDVEDLKTLCCGMLTASVNPENVIKYLYLSHTLSISNLFRFAIQVVKWNWEEVRKSEEWNELEKSNNDLAFFVRSTLDDDQY